MQRLPLLYHHSRHPREAFGCIVDVRKYQMLGVPAVIHVMELMRSEGKERLGRILEKGNPGTQTCGVWLPRQKQNPGR